jgi:demethylmenaquinone methyltransferase/2-methoxy-6-polyprenyl-1,4-benzoquinol methylase
METYYAERAAEFEAVYAKPERQADLAALRALLQATLADHDVLEVACGTGYWTQVIAAAARSLLATDVNEPMLAIARRKTYPPGRVRFRRADAFDLDGVGEGFTAAFAGFWWSHLTAQQGRAFLRGLHRVVGAGGQVALIDNRYVEGSSTPIARRDADGNTYQWRRRADGRRFELLKNFPDEGDLRAAVSAMGEVIEYRALTYFWLLRYRVADEAESAARPGARDDRGSSQ